MSRARSASAGCRRQRATDRARDAHLQSTVAVRLMGAPPIDQPNDRLRHDRVASRAPIAVERIAETVPKLRPWPERPSTHHHAIVKDAGDDGDVGTFHPETELGELR